MKQDMVNVAGLVRGVTAAVLTWAVPASALAGMQAEGAKSVAATPAPVQTTAQVAAQHGAAVSPQPALRLDIPHSWNPLRTYLPTTVPPANLSNSPRMDGMIKDGKLYLSLADALALALENNLDLAIARYNIPIAAADVMRTQAGGSFRGVNTGVVQNTPGGGSSAGAGVGGGAGGTTSGAGGAGSGASGLVESTLGSGSTVSSFDPVINGTFSVEHYTEPLSNTQVYGVKSFQLNTTIGNLQYEQAFPTGTLFEFNFENNREAENSPNTSPNPTLNSMYQVYFQQQLLAGFGTGTNLRYLRIARNNQKISDAAFKLQVISTVTQIEDMYWDLVKAYEDEGVKDRALAFAQQTLESGRQQLALNSIPELDVLKDEGAVAAAEQDVTVAKTTLQYQELLMKNAITKNLDDPGLEAMPVIPSDSSNLLGATADLPEGAEDKIALALKQRVELQEAEINLQNSKISRIGTNNGLLPTVALSAYYSGSGLAGPNNPSANITSTAPKDFGGAVKDAFNNSSPDYYVGLSVSIPLRNRIAKSDQYRSELEFRQSELLLEQLKKQIRIEVRNAQYALEQSHARVEAAERARDLAQKSFDIQAKEQVLGAGSAMLTLASRHDLTVAESALVTARTAERRAAVDLDRATGSTLDANAISVESAERGSAR